MTMPATVTKNPATKIGRILFVDDDHRLLEALQRRYRKEFDIQLAGNPSEGLALLKNDGPFAVIVSDYRMPFMDGITLLRRAREISPDTVRVLLTGSNDVQVATNAVSQGEVFRFLHKPCKEMVLTSILRVALRHYYLQEGDEELATNETDSVATLGHELQAPLASIRASADALLACSDTDTISREALLSTIATESDQLSRLIREFLDDSEVADDGVPPKFESIDLPSVIKTAIAATQDLRRRFVVGLEVDIIDDAPDFPGDSSGLIQVFGNLLRNAILATPRGKTVEVRFTRSTGGYEVRIADRGPDVDDETKERIFERSRQGDEVPTNRPQGAGLVLAITQRVIERHGGTIRCEPNPTGGVVFVVALPRDGARQPI